MPVLLSAFFYQLYKLSSSDHINTCRDRRRLSHHRLLIKFHDPAVFVHLDTSESGSVFSADVCADNCNIRSLCNVIFQYLIIIQFVYTVS